MRLHEVQLLFAIVILATIAAALGWCSKEVALLIVIIQLLVLIVILLSRIYTAINNHSADLRSEKTIKIMEEIKFKVLEKDAAGELVIFGYERLTDQGWERKRCPGDWEKGVFDKEKVKRSRFSGYLEGDKNEIYEGDILKLKNEDNEEIQVICRFGHAHRDIYGANVDIVGFYFELPNLKKSFPIIDNYQGKHDCDIMEITGNIYE